ncbi:MAG TPA: FtsX-like permease family protein [Rhodocyclaceae bacterium]|nr:FtsX-like permease family protein [Rhodocyclaceae bacterium]HND23134.1 FtsX-like permease family protein [Rhodocyclaceae bacterium]
MSGEQGKPGIIALMKPQILAAFRGLQNRVPDVWTAYRNVTRHRRRTSFALIIIVGGIISFLLTGGFIHWMLDNMREGVIHSQYGHIQIVRPGYFQTGISDPYRYLLPADARIDPRIGATAGVATVTPRLALAGLVSFGDATLTFIGDGVDPAGDAKVSRDITILSGEPLSADDPNGIIVGQGLAANLGVKAGDKMVLMSTTAKGGLGASDVRVRAIFSTFSKEYDDNAVRVPITLARKIVKVQGATAWVVLLEDTDKTERVRAALAGILSGGNFELVPWMELADFYQKTRDLFLKQVLVVEVLVSMIVVLSIGNTLQMAVVERTGEIGTMMALGARQKDVLRLFLMESAVLGMLGGLIGAVAGWVLAVLISWIGIPLPPPPGMTEGFDAEILVNFSLAFNGFVLALITTLVAGVWPAWKASRMNIVDALRRQI